MAAIIFSSPIVSPVSLEIFGVLGDWDRPQIMPVPSKLMAPGAGV